MISCPTWINRPLAALSLRARLALGFGFALLLTGVLMGASLWGAQRAEEALASLHDVAFPLHDAVLHIRNDLLEARRQEKEFLLRWRELGFGEARTRHVSLLRAHLANIPPRLAEIGRLGAGDPEIAGLAREIEKAVADYQRDFLASVDLIGRLGFIDSGLEGAFRSQAHTIEELLPSDALPLRADLLQMRRLEKDYLLRGRSQDAAALYQGETRFRASLARAALPAPLRAQLTALTQDYRERFTEYARVSDEIERLRRVWLAAAARTEAPLQQIYTRAEARAQDTHNRALVMSHHNSIVVLGAGTLALLLGLLVAVALWRSIMLAVDNAVAFAEKIAGGDLSARLPGHGGGEFGRLAESLNHMADGLQHAHNALQAINAELEQRIAQRTLHIRAANRGLSERTREMALLAELIEWLLVSTSCIEVERSIGHFFEQLFPQGSGRFYLRRDNSDIFESQSEWGAPCGAPPTLAAHSCLTQRQDLAQCACEDHPGACFRTPGQRATLCVPLVSQSETFGMIYIELPATGGVSGDRIDPSDKMLAAVMVKQVALGLTNLRLREALREQAIRDALTGLYNRRYLEETLAREVERARRKEGKLAAIMLDVDHFKRFNDTYGHEAGDVVLAAIGRLLREVVRASDVPCRFGGEEFTVLLPDTDAALAAERAELIRRAAHDLHLEYDGKTLPGVTVSLGAAEFPLHGETGADLLAAADAALYRAKEGGRDRVAVAFSTLSPGPSPINGRGETALPLPASTPPPSPACGRGAGGEGGESKETQQ